MDELRRIRRERGWSQQKLSNESGVNKSTINQVEQGKRTPGIQTLEKLAGALEVEIGDFFPKAQSPLPLELDDSGRGLQLWTQHASSLAEDLEELAESGKAEKWERREGRYEGAYLAATSVLVTIERLLELIEDGEIQVSSEERNRLLRDGFRLAKAADRLDELATPGEEDVMAGIRASQERTLTELRFRSLVEKLELTEADREEIFA